MRNQSMRARQPFVSMADRSFYRAWRFTALDYSLLIVYALTYCALYLSVAIWGFKKRQFNSLA